MVIVSFTLLSFNIFSPTTWTTVVITSAEREIKVHPEAPKLLPNVPKLPRGNEIIITEK